MNLASLALVLNAAIWGLSWMPFRWLSAHGLSVLWATAIAYAIAFLALSIARPRHLKILLSLPALWGLGLAYGLTNAAFNWAITIGEVVRVILLFYLMPLWAALFARLILKEHIGPEGAIRLAVAVLGAALVLWSPQMGFAFPSSFADWLAILGGMGFGFANVLLRKMKDIGQTERTLAMFAGSTLLPLAVILILGVGGQLASDPSAFGSVLAQTTGHMASPLSATTLAWLGLLPLACALGLANFSLQYGAARLPTQVTALLMMSEIVFASGSAVIWGGEGLDRQEILGGLLIVSAAIWATLRGAR